MITEVRQADSVIILTCPGCWSEHYADRAFTNQHGIYPVGTNPHIIIGCEYCRIPIRIRWIPAHYPLPVRREDLKSIVLAGNITAENATDEQFGAWAATFMPIADDDDAVWTEEMRIDFCDVIIRDGKFRRIIQGEIVDGRREGPGCSAIAPVSDVQG